MSGFSAKNSHDIFIDFLSKKKLNELLHRASFDTNVGQPLLQKQIQERLANISSIKPKVKIGEDEITIKGITYNRCSIYIDFYSNKIQVGHFTLHFYKNNENAAGNVGRIHFKNDRKKLRHTIKFNKNNKNTIYMNYLEFPDKIQPYLEVPFQVVKSILNEYINPDSELFLGKKLTSMSDAPHICTIRTEKVFQPTTRKISTTRKTHQKYKSHYN